MFRAIGLPRVGLVLLLASYGVAASAVTTFSVNDTADLVDDNLADGICHTAQSTCSLRAAIMQANHTADESKIVLASGVFGPSIPAAGDDGEDTGDFNVTASDSVAPLTIVGLGIGSTAANAGTGSRVLHVESGRSVRIVGMNITGGRALSGQGGAILNEGTLELDDCIVQGSAASIGGGIFNAGTLTLQRSRVTGNGGQGGGIANVATLLLVDSRVDNNNGHISGGIWSHDGEASLASVTAIRSEFSANSGDVGAFCCSGDLVLVNSTVAGNVTNSVGGGINFSAESGRANAAAIYNTSIVDNTASIAGAGIAIGTGATFTTINSLIARNERDDGAFAQDCSGVIEAEGRNLFGSIDGCAISGDAASFGLLDSLDSLGTLANNGGPTRTIALLAGSSAIDGGDPAGCRDDTGALLTTDQRGFLHPPGTPCDVGAYELDGIDPDLIFRDGFENG